MNVTLAEHPVNIMSDTELLQLSSDFDHLRFEIVEGELITMSPLGAFTGNLEAKYIGELYIWAKENNAKSYSSDAGFKLPNGNVRVPNASIILPDNPNYGKKIEKFFPGSPDFLIEIRSQSDSLTKLKKNVRLDE